MPNFAQLTPTPKKHIYILTGGINSKLDHIYADTYVFNIQTNSMYRLPNMKQPRYTHSALWLDGYVYVIGGRYFG